MDIILIGVAVSKILININDYVANLVININDTVVQRQEQNSSLKPSSEQTVNRRLGF